MRELKREGRGRRESRGADRVEVRGELSAADSLCRPLHGGWALGIEFKVNRLVEQAPYPRSHPADLWF